MSYTAIIFFFVYTNNLDIRFFFFKFKIDRFSNQVQFLYHFFFSLSHLLSEIIEYNTIIIESAIELSPRNKLQQSSGQTITTQHFDIISTTDDSDKVTDKSDHDHAIITKVEIEPTTTTTTKTIRQQPKEIVSYQRFGRIDKKNNTSYPFKCHLCGFSCRFKESLLSHFKEVHPN